MKFNVWLKWMDDRLQYQNLNKHQFWNAIPSDLAKKIWKPHLVFENNDNRQILKYVESSSVLMLVRKGHASGASLEQIDEARVYKSNETELVLRSLHFLKFNCDFDVTYIPFDRQTCYAEVFAGNDFTCCLHFSLMIHFNFMFESKFDS